MRIPSVFEQTLRRNLGLMLFFGSVLGSCGLPRGGWCESWDPFWRWRRIRGAVLHRRFFDKEVSQTGIKIAEGVLRFVSTTGIGRAPEPTHCCAERGDVAVDVEVFM